jgi:hypothetical protein
VPTAKIIAHAAADNLTPVSFELGGKSPCIIMGDADLDLAAEIAVEQYDNAGQVCLSGTRILVHESVADEFAEKFREKAAAIVQGDPRDPATDIGPQIHQVHFDRIKGFVDRAAAEGGIRACDLPDGMPWQVRIAIGRNDLVPRRIEWLAIPGPRPVADRPLEPIGVMDFHDAEINGPIDPTAFFYQPASAGLIDVTEMAVNSLQLMR